MKILLLFGLVLIASLALAVPTSRKGDDLIIDLGPLLRIDSSGGSGSILGARWGWGHGKDGAYGYGGWGPFGGGGGIRRRKENSVEKSKENSVEKSKEEE